MPQLDLFTFFPQIFWGFLFFFVQFFVISYYFLPLLASTLKFKQKYLITLFQKETSTQIQTFIQKDYNALLLGSIKEIENLFGNIYSICNVSDKNFRLNLLTKTFVNVNSQIIKTPFLFCALPRFYSFVFNSLKAKKNVKNR